MTQAVCFKCGEMKWGAFGNCKACGAQPQSDDDLMLALAFTDHYFDQSKLEQIGRDIKAGIRPQLSESLKEKLSPAIKESKVMLGLNRTAGPKQSDKRRSLFYSPGLTWPFIAAVAALIMMWTLLAINMRLVPSRESPVVFGLVFGLLSGVVLFAIMRAFDRSRHRG